MQGPPIIENAETTLKDEVKAVLNLFPDPAKCEANKYKISEGKIAIIIFCFDNNEDFEAFNKFLEENINPADFPAKSNEENKGSLELAISDGHEGYELIKVKNLPKGLVKETGDPQDLMIFYKGIENLNGKKCSVLQNLPIIPVKFLDNGILNPQCVLKFRHDNVDLYLGLKHPTCQNTMKNLKEDMIKSCMEIVDAKELVDRNKPEDGLWSGNVLIVKMTKGKPKEYELEEGKFDITPKLVTINSKGKVETLEFKKLKWPCNNDGGCKLGSFYRAYDQTKLEQDYGNRDDLKKKIMEKWNEKLPDTNSCVVLELFNGIRVLCPERITEEYNMKKALSITTDMELFDKPSDRFEASPDDTFEVIYSKETDTSYKELKIKVRSEGIEDNQGTMLIDYDKISQIEKVLCPIDFRFISLPLHFADMESTCCAKITTEEKNFLCVQNQSKCYIQLRQMILKIRNNCLEHKGLSLKKETSNKTESLNKFEVVFNKIDPWKYRGEVMPIKGTISMDKVFLSLKDTLGKEEYKFNYEWLVFPCEKSEKPCSFKEFERFYYPLLNAETDKIWFENTIRNFFEINSNLKEEQCMFLISQNSQNKKSKVILTCSTKPDQGEFLRSSISKFYLERISSFSNESPELKDLPEAMKNQEFPVKIITVEKNSFKDDVDPNKSIIKIESDGIIFKNSGEVLFKYENIVDLKENKIIQKFKVDKAKIKAEINKLNENCCFSIETKINTIYVCADSEARCYYDKSIIYSVISKKATKQLDYETAKIRRRNNSIWAADDPFEFGKTQIYKEYGPDIDKLKIETLDISNNGIWHGWVFFAPLTDRNYNNKVSPVWIEIEDGKISIKTDITDKYPYKVLDLKHYEQICEGHCLPYKYLEKKLKARGNYEDTFFLKKTINSVTSLLLRPFDEEACTILDFIDPQWDYGHSYIFCSVDSHQGSRIRQTIDTSYYESLLSMDVENDVRKPYIETEKFKVVLIINGEIESKYNTVKIVQDGVNALSYTDNYQSINKEVQKLTIAYKDMSSDNFGNQCALWYKNLGIKNRGGEFNSLINDDNCCIRFFTGPEKKKTEICVVSQNGEVCLKKSRQLIKGIKTYCISYNKNLAAASEGHDEVEKMIDIYSDKTVDDSDNGNFDGFAFIGSAIKPSQNLRQVPIFIKIRKTKITMFADPESKKPDITIPTENIVFSCKDSYPCKPSSFKTQMVSLTKDTILKGSLTSTYNLFKDTYGYNDDTFEKNCFILEDKKSPFLVCSNKENIFPIIKKALVKAFNLNFSCKEITSPVETDPTMEYKVKIFNNDKPSSDSVKVSGQGVILTSNKGVLFDPASMDKDPVTGANCAVWFKELPNKVKFAYPRCCFAVSIKSQIITVCQDSGEMCLGDSFKLLKSVWNMCMSQDGTNLILPPDPDPEVLGQTRPWTPKVPFNPKKLRFRSCAEKRKTKVFEDKFDDQKDFLFDNYNDIAFSTKKALYKGWFKVYPVQSAQSEHDYLKLYGEFSRDTLMFFENDIEKTTPKLLLRPDLLSMACGFTTTCKPVQFLTKAQEYKITLNFEKYRNLINRIEMNNDSGCAVLQKIGKDGHQFYFICVHLKHYESNLPELEKILRESKGFKEKRNTMNSFYGDILRKIIYETYLIGRKFIDVKKLPSHEGSFKKLKYSKDNSEKKNVEVVDSGVKADGKEFIKYSDLKICKVIVNVIYAPTNTLYNDRVQCCLRYETNESREFICLNDINCDAEALRFAHLFKTKCEKSFKTDATILNELSHMNTVKIAPILKKVFIGELKLSNALELNPAPSAKSNPPKPTISSQAFITINKTLFIKYLFKARKMIHSINLGQPYNSQEYPRNQKPDKNKIVPEFIGEFIGSDKWKLTVYNKNKKIYEDSKNQTVLIYNDSYYIKHKEFHAVFNPNLKSTLIKYKRDNIVKVLFIIDNDFYLTTSNKIENNRFTKSNI